jgi:hypothetical protein
MWRINLAQMIKGSKYFNSVALKTVETATPRDRRFFFRFKFVFEM